MADPFVAEIRIFPFNFAPKGWAFCNGQVMPISQNTALFSLLGTTYGGDGKSTFALPDLQGNVPVHAGQGQGLSLWDLGEVQGVTDVTLVANEMPAHIHSIQATTLDANSMDPTGRRLARSINNVPYAAGPANSTMAPDCLLASGGNLPHNNMMPYLTLNFCIALQGVFPQRT